MGLVSPHADTLLCAQGQEGPGSAGLLAGGNFHSAFTSSESRGQ